MDPIAVLMEEHRAIEKVLRAVQGCAAVLEAGGDVPREDIVDFAEFIGGFADGRHHGKEEDLLFAALTAHGMPAEVGPIAVMMAEHGAARRLAGILRGAGTRTGPLDVAEREQIVDALRGYTELLTAHIWKEENVLYPMARQYLNETVMTELSTQFADFGRQQERTGATSEMAALAQRLIVRYPS